MKEADPDSSDEQVTRLLRRMAAGDGQASAELAPMVYDELRRMAERQMREESPGHTLQPTALVNEAFVRLLGARSPLQLESRTHFMSVAAKVMRRVLVDHERRRSAQKRGAGRRVELDTRELVEGEGGVDVLAVDDAMRKLEGLDPELAQIVELRFFGGLSAEETARAIGVSEPTIHRAWRVGRIWFRRELAEG